MGLSSALVGSFKCQVGWSSGRVGSLRTQLMLPHGLVGVTKKSSYCLKVHFQESSGLVGLSSGLEVSC